MKVNRMGNMGNSCENRYFSSQNTPKLILPTHALLAMSYLFYVPLLISVTLPITFVITYVWAVEENDVYPVFPNTSDAGATPPESCLFSMMLNLVAGALIFTVYVRHKEVVEVFRSKQPKDVPSFGPILNTVSTITGFVSCVGLDILANFQVTDLPLVHFIGSLLCFIGGAVYIFQQAILTYWLAPEMNGLPMVAIRGVLGVFTVIFVITSQVTIKVALDNWGNNTQPNVTQYLHWNPSDGGWEWRVVSSATEWAASLAVATFILTFTWDFRRITLYPPELEMYSDPVPDPARVISFRTI